MSTENIFRIRRELLEEKVKTIASELDIDEDKAFMRHVYALLFDTDYYDTDYDDDVVDGGGDKGIDIIRTEEYDEGATIHLVQVKNSARYSSNSVILMRNALSWIFMRKEKEYKKIANQDFVMKISDIRRIMQNKGPKKIELFMYFVAKGDADKISPEFENEVQIIKKEYTSTEIFKKFDFKVWGITELSERSEEIAQQKSSVNVDIPIYAHPLPTVPSYIIYNSGSIKSIICTVAGSEIAKIVDNSQDKIFEENVRRFLGVNSKNKNKKILETCTSDKDAEYFWFFNNGITVTCDSFDVVFTSAPPIVKVMNMQIVNGCQTSMTLREALKSNKLNYKTYVLLKIFETKDNDFVDKITLTTNSQNVVTSRDLCSNDQYQRYLGEWFEKQGYHYERKPHMFSNKEQEKTDRKKIIHNAKVGQAHIAVVQHQPAVAMGQRGKIWLDDYYEDTFSSQPEELLASYLIYDYCCNKSKKLNDSTTDAFDKAILKYGKFHLARIIGNLEIGEHWKNAALRSKLSDLIEKLKHDSTVLDRSYSRAILILRRVIEDLSQKDPSKLYNIFKSGEIEQALNEKVKEA